jgi:outer membrane protein OmpA-like peptidoglycan-associated protein
MKIVFACITMLCCLPGITQGSLVVHFDVDDFRLTAGTRARLDSFLTERGTGPSSIKLVLEGHCDGSGPGNYNQELSEKRSLAVRNYLVKHGMAAGAIVRTSGYGEERPLNENKSVEDRKQNRRVEILIVPATESGIKKPVDPSLIERIRDSSSVGKSIALKNINFYGSMHRLLPESLPALTELLEVMKSNPTLVIEIHGHVCCQPHAEDALDVETRMYNLSEARAKAVHDHLMANGIDKTRLAYKGFGHSMPLHPYPETNEEEREANRRVEIKIVSL